MQRSGTRLASGLAACLLALAWALPAPAADVQRVEALGVAELGAGASSRRSPRDLALRQALREAVRQVAAVELAGLALPPSEEDLVAALGADPFEFASRFRVLEDRGKQPALEASDPRVTHVYVVLAEVHVDAVRVRQRLADAGLLIVPSGEGPGDRVWIALEDLTSWHEIQAVRKLLRDVGARNPIPVEIEQGRAVLEAETRHSPERLLQELVRRAPETLEIQPLGLARGGLRLRARVRTATPPAARDPARRFDTPRAERY
jgi:hypothetical protein